MNSTDLSYILNELGEDREQYFNAVAPPIFQTSNFAFKTVAALREGLQHEPEVVFYTRGNNPTTDMLEKKVAALEGAEEGLAFASGIAAVSAAVISQLKAGDHVICVQRPYSWTFTLMTRWLPRYGVEVTFVDGKNIENFKKALRSNTRLIYLESPTSFTFELQDIPAVAALAKENNCITIIDNSYSSPIFQHPVKMGVDISVQAATKYIAGHSDTMGGIICSSKEIILNIFENEYMTLGGISAPLNSWLMIRGLRTLPLRMERISNTTLQVAQWLENHPKVEKVFYPFLPSNPQYELAQRQMAKGAGQFSVLLKTTDVSQIDLFCDSLHRFLMAASWGGHESLIYPVAASYNSGNYRLELPINMIRFYIGLEEPQVLLEDLEQALGRIS